MSATAIVLVTFSVLFHAIWNLSLKEESRQASFLVSFNVFAALIVFPFAVYALVHIQVYLANMPFLILGSVCNAAYYIFLMLAYRTGDFSLAYPIARAVPIIVVTAAGALFGEYPSIPGLVGIALIVTGCFILPLDRLKASGAIAGFLVSPMLGFALLAALCTAGYSIFDKFGSKPAFETLGLPGSLGYLGIHTFLTAAFLLTMARFGLGERHSVIAMRGMSVKAMRTGFLMIVSYGLVMVAYQFAKTGYVVGFRQLSIPLGVALGAITLRERVGSVRIIGTTIILVGLFLIALA